MGLALVGFFVLFVSWLLPHDSLSAVAAETPTHGGLTEA